MENRISSRIEALMRIAIEKGQSAALDYIDLHISEEVRSARARYEELLKEENSAKNIVSMAFATASSLPQQESIEPDASPDVRSQVLDIALEMANKHPQKMVHLVEITNEVAKRGVILDSTRPGTSIGNMLFKAENWQRLGAGLYRLAD